MEMDLNPCPECLLAGEVILQVDDEGLFFISCACCGLSGKRFETAAAAMFYWNGHTRNRVAA